MMVSPPGSAGIASNGAADSRLLWRNRCDCSDLVRQGELPKEGMALTRTANGSSQAAMCATVHSHRRVSDDNLHNKLTVCMR